MCVPCVAANPIVWDILFWVLVILGVTLAALASFLRAALPAVFAAGIYTWRYLTGATMVKDYWKRERDMPARPYARRVHAVTRIGVPTAAVTFVAYPWVAAVSAVMVATVVPALFVEKYHQRKTLAAKAAGEPIRVRATVGQVGR